MAAFGMFVTLTLLSALELAHVQSWSPQDRVLLRDIQAITLYADRYTNSRRTSPVPQLKCVGGSAGNKAVPQVVQCHNRGWDGIDVQWECKVDMDNTYRFGKVEVNCEGFDYPDDPYILRGSCGLEYTLEYTEEGSKKSNDGYSAGGFGSGFFQGQSKSWNSPSSSDGGGVIVLVVIVLLAYGVYKLFLSGPSMQQQPHPDEYGYGHQTHASAPPPPGFKSDFTGSSGSFGGGSAFGDGSAFGGGSTFGGHGTQRPGFWTGLGTGGVLGYLFGNRRAQPYQTPYFNNWSGPTYSGSMYGAPPPSRGPQSSGVRTASGFGGTKRR